MNKVKRAFSILGRGVSYILTLMLVVAILLLIPVILIATGILGTTSTEQFVNQPGDGALVEGAELIGMPEVEIVTTTAPQSYGVDYQVHVDCTVKNYFS